MTEDLPLVTRQWNNFFVMDQVTSDELETRFFHNRFVNPVNPSFNELAFSLAASRGDPFFYERDEDDKGWILGAGFTNESDDLVQLMNAQLEEFARRKIGRVFYSNMVPNYFLPGLDEDRYAKLKLPLWEIGFKQVQKVISMEADLVDISQPKGNPIGFEVSSIRDNERNGLLSFISSNFPADWYFRAKEVLENGTKEQVVVARRSNKIIGYGMFSSDRGAKWYVPGERFGPFGVLEAERSNGVGTVILYQLIKNMRALNVKRAYFLWTDEKASHLYKRAGFRITRTFTILEKVIFRYL